MKKASGFALTDLEEKGTTYKVAQTDSMPENEAEAIFLDIIGEDTLAVTDLKNRSTLSKKSKLDFYHAYQKLHKTFSFKRGIPAKEKSVFFELVGTMLQAGIPVIQSIRLFSEQTKHKYFKTVAQAITYQLEKGTPLSKALQDYRKIFSESEIGMISSGEATGRLNEVLLRLAVEVNEGIALRSKIKSAMIYPAIVVGFVILAVYSMLRFVIPQMSKLFDSTGLELPAVTQLLISLSNFVVEHGILVVGGFFLFIISIASFMRTNLGKQIFHRLYLKLPVASEFLRAIYQARFARSISNLLSAGVAIVDAVNITARSMNNVVYKSKIFSIAKDVSQGITISESIQDSPYFSNLTVSMMSVGEKTAQVDDLARKIAEYYEQKAANMAENFSKIIQPLIILVVGGLVAMVILAIMLPMTELLSGIDNL